MNKKNALWILLDLIFLIVFNVVFFVLTGTEHSATVWISYGFIHFAYLMLLITPFLIRKSSSTAVFGFSLYSISSTYFLIVFIMGIIFIVVNPDSYKVCLVTHVIVAGLYAVSLLSNLIANEHTADSIEQHEMELKYVKESSSKLKSILDRTSDRKMKKLVEKAYDTVHSSPVKSNSSVMDLELDVMELIDTLNNMINNADEERVKSLINKIINQAEERNRRLKYRS